MSKNGNLLSTDEKAEVHNNFFASVFTSSFSPRPSCYGFAWQGFGSRGATGVASVRSCEKLPPCLIKPVPAGSKTDSLLAKAKAISNGGSASVIMYLRRGRKKLCCESAV